LLSATGALSLQVSPNPSATQFSLRIAGVKAGKPATLIVSDALGRVVEQKTIIADGTTVQVGSNYRPGTYFVQVVQGAEKVTLKLVKTAGF
jgi:hypothetical protein